MSHTTELFIMAAVWCVIAAVIVRFITPSWPGRIGLFAVLVGIPFWELPYGYYNFQRLCAQEARLVVFEPLIPQESICFDDFYEDVYGAIAKAGLRRIEYRGSTNFKPRNATSVQVEKVARGSEKSLYCFDTATNIRLPWRIWRHDNLINRVSDGQNVARTSSLRWAGMWWQEDLKPIFGDGGSCWVSFDSLFAAVKLGTKGAPSARNQ